MKAMFRNTVGKARFLGPAVVVVAALVLTSSIVYAGTTTHLRLVQEAEDQFYNYSFQSQTASSTNVVWPITMVFYNNAWINKVKNIYWGLAIGATEWARMYEAGNGWIWDSDMGTKASMHSDSLNAYVWVHMRLYAPNPPDYIVNGKWGKCVIGATHYDQFPFETWSGYSEYAEIDCAMWAITKGYATYYDSEYFYNPESLRTEGKMIWYNDGYVTCVYVP